MWFSRVVLPAPKKPVRMVTGSPLGARSIGAVGAAMGLVLLVWLLVIATWRHTPRGRLVLETVWRLGG